MELKSIKKVNDGKYLKKYDITYLNKEGNEKVLKRVLKDKSRTLYKGRAKAIA